MKTSNIQEFHLNDGNRARITKTYFYRADARLINGRKHFILTSRPNVISFWLQRCMLEDSKSYKSGLKDVVEMYESVIKMVSSKSGKKL